VTSRGKGRAHKLSSAGLPLEEDINCTLKSIIPGLNEPFDVTTDSKGRIIVTEWSGHCISIFSPEWVKIQLLGSGSTSSTEGQFSTPAGVHVTVNNDDNIYIVDYCIQKFSSDGRFVASVNTHGRISCSSHKS